MRDNPIIQSLRRLSFASSSHSSSSDGNSEDELSSQELLLEQSNESSVSQQEATTTLAPRTARPGVLYGRAREQCRIIDRMEHILDANHLESELVLLTGSHGTGKTTLALSLRPVVRRRNGHFVRGQFDPPRSSRDDSIISHHQHNNNNVIMSTSNTTCTTPQSPLLVALADFCDSALLSQSYEQIVLLRTKIIKAVERDLAILTTLLPPLVDLLGSSLADQQQFHEEILLSDEPSSTLEARARRSVCRFVSAVCSLDEPLFMFLDNVQWSDPESLQLLRALLTDADMEGLIIVCACRSDEVTVNDDLSIILRSMEDHDGVKITEVKLDNLKPDDVISLTADTLGTTPTLGTSIARFVYEQTKGNCYYTVQLLRVMRQSGLLAPYSPDSNGDHNTQTQELLQDTTFSCSATLAFWSSNFQEAAMLFEKGKKTEMTHLPLSTRCKLFFLEGISNLQLAMNTSGTKKNRRRWIGRARRRIQFLRQCIQKAAAPENLSTQVLLLEAELTSAEGNGPAAFPKYEKAFIQASKEGMMHAQALCAELLGLSYYKTGTNQLQESVSWLRRARTIYSDFGAHGKVKQLNGAIRKLESIKGSASSPF